jgi:RNA polymerase sigma-70 factor (ECF subfamily)
VVLEAGQAGSQSAPQALERLCRTYWSPIYAYIRRRGFGPEEAQDLTQGFFLHWLQNNALSAVDRNKGRFRSFLLVCLKNFLSNEWDRARRQKRGGGQRMLSLETEALESECSASADPKLTPEKVFDRRWALMILDHTLEALRAEQVQAGKARQFEKLACFLSAEGTAESYASLAAELELSREAVAMAVWRLRQRFRTLLLQEIRGMVSSPEQVKEELACLMAALRD